MDEMVSSATPPCRSIIHTVAVGDLRQQRSDRKSASPHARCAHLRVGSGLAVVAVRPFRRALLLRPEVRPSDLAPSTDHRHAKHRLDVCEVRCDHYIAANRTTSQRTALHSAAQTVLHSGRTALHSGRTVLHSGRTVLHSGRTVLHSGRATRSDVVAPAPSARHGAAAGAARARRRALRSPA